VFYASQKFEDSTPNKNVKSICHYAQYAVTYMSQYTKHTPAW